MKNGVALLQNTLFLIQNSITNYEFPLTVLFSQNPLSSVYLRKNSVQMMENAIRCENYISNTSENQKKNEKFFQNISKFQIFFYQAALQSASIAD